MYFSFNKAPHRVSWEVIVFIRQADFKVELEGVNRRLSLYMKFQQYIRPVDVHITVETVHYKAAFKLIYHINIVISLLLLNVQ